MNTLLVHPILWIGVVMTVTFIILLLSSKAKALDKADEDAIIKSTTPKRVKMSSELRHIKNKYGRFYNG